MNKLLSMLIASVMFFTAFGTVIAVDTSYNSTVPTEDIQPTDSTDIDESTTTIMEQTPSELQSRYPNGNFNITKLGDLGAYGIYYNVTEQYTFMDYNVFFGDYVFDCFAQQPISDLGLFVVGNRSAYTLKEAYDQGLVNIESVVALIYEKDNIHYNFRITRTETPVVETPQKLQNRYPSNEFSLAKLGDLGAFSLYYNITEYYHYQEYNETLGEYVFNCFAQQLPYELGLYVVDNYNAYTLKEAYNQGLVNIESVVPLINSHNRIKYNFNITKAPTTVPKTTKPIVKAPKLSQTKVNVKSGRGKTLKVTNGIVKLWSSSNKKVISVNKGKVTALNKGLSTVTAILTTGKKLTCTVTVTTAPRLSKTTVKVKKGGTATVKVNGKVSTINNKYTNTKIAKITSKTNAATLKIKGLKKGTTTLKIKVNGVKTLNLKVNVK